MIFLKLKFRKSYSPVLRTKEMSRSQDLSLELDLLQLRPNIQEFYAIVKKILQKLKLGIKSWEVRLNYKIIEHIWINSHLSFSLHS
jgi:hypothetical protein